jgi:anti-sigma regulatory factor (Ser/Thr protein kinase)
LHWFSGTDGYVFVMEIARPIPASYSAPRTARHAIEPLGRFLDQRTVWDVQLLISEIVTIMIEHATPGDTRPLQLRVSIAADRVRLEVRGAESGSDARPPERLEASDPSSGLALIGTLASRWGRLSSDDGYWAEVDLESRPA